MTHELDPRLYGIAPREADAHEGEVLWTMAAVLKFVGISETTLRLTSDLMRLRRTIRPKVHRWIPAEVRAYVASIPIPPVPVSITKALHVTRTQKRRKVRAAKNIAKWEAEFDAKMGTADLERRFHAR